MLQTCNRAIDSIYCIAKFSGQKSPIIKFRLIFPNAHKILQEEQKNKRHQWPYANCTVHCRIYANICIFPVMYVTY